MIIIANAGAVLARQNSFSRLFRFPSSPRLHQSLRHFSKGTPCFTDNQSSESAPDQSWYTLQVMQAQRERLQTMREEVETEIEAAKTQLQPIREEVQETKAQRNRFIVLEEQVKEQINDVQLKRKELHKAKLDGMREIEEAKTARHRMSDTRNRLEAEVKADADALRHDIKKHRREIHEVMERVRARAWANTINVWSRASLFPIGAILASGLSCIVWWLIIIWALELTDLWKSTTQEPQNDEQIDNDLSGYEFPGQIQEQEWKNNDFDVRSITAWVAAIFALLVTFTPLYYILLWIWTP